MTIIQLLECWDYFLLSLRSQRWSEFPLTRVMPNWHNDSLMLNPEDRFDNFSGI